MAGKTVVLCEGQHDLIFLSLLLKRAKRKFMSKNWKQIDASGGETVVIRDFLKPNEGSSVLIKQDENRDTCINHFFEPYKGGEERYSLKMVLDSDGGITWRNLHNQMQQETQKDLLNKVSEYRFSLKTEEPSGIFLYPTTLTNEVLKITHKKLDNQHGVDSQKTVLKEFLDLAKDNDIKWVKELERFLLDLDRGA